MLPTVIDFDQAQCYRALKRLRPPPKQAAGNKKRRLIGGKQRQVQQDAKAAADSFLSELEGACPAMRVPCTEKHVAAR